MTTTLIEPDSALAKRFKQFPPSTVAKFEKLRRAELRARAAIDGLAAAMEREREARDEERRELGLWDRHHRSVYLAQEEGKPVQFVETPERAAIVQRIDARTAELQRLQAEIAAVPLTDTGPLVSWLRHQEPTARFLGAEAPLPKLGRNETLAAALERNVSEQQRIADELATVGNAPRTIAEAKAAMRDQIERLAARGRPGVNGLFSGEAIAWPQENIQAGGFGAHDYVVGFLGNDALAMAVWANKDEIIRALEKEIDEQGDDSAALSADAQKVKVLELEARRLGLQRQAETIIVRLEADGLQHVQRTCRIPEVLLGIERAR